MKKEEAPLQQAVIAKGQCFSMEPQTGCSTGLQNEAMQEKLNTAKWISLWSEMNFFTLPP